MFLSVPRPRHPQQKHLKKKKVKESHTHVHLTFYVIEGIHDKQCDHDQV